MQSDITLSVLLTFKNSVRSKIMVKRLSYFLAISSSIKKLIYLDKFRSLLSVNKPQDLNYAIEIIKYL